MRRFLRRIGDGGGLAAFTPLSLPWELLLDSRQIAPVSNGSPFSLWPDISGKGRDASAFASVPLKPIYRTASSPTGLPLGDFGPPDSGRQMFGTLPVTPIDASNGFSFYAWYIGDNIQEDPLFDEQIVLACEVAGGFRLYAVRDVTFPTVLDVAFSTTTRIEGSVPTLGVHTLACTCAPPIGVGASTLYYDGVVIATGTWNCGPNTQYWLSGNSGGNLTMQGRIGFAGFGARADSPAVVAAMLGYLRRTWG